VAMISSMRLDEKLERLARRKGLKQADVARAVKGLPGAAKSSVANWFAGLQRPSLEAALRIARLLGVSVDYLADDDLDEPEAVSFSEDQLAILQWVEEKRLSRNQAIEAISLYAAARGKPPAVGDAPSDRDERAADRWQVDHRPPTTTSPVRRKA
jgi:transcriptional regulator with XRE-family HTH domain